MRLTLFLTILLAGFQGYAQRQVVVDDLSSHWLVHNSNGFKVWEGDPVHTIYLHLQLKQFNGYTLQIQAGETFRLFIDGKLQPQYSSNTRMPIDSLLRKFGDDINLAIHFTRQGAVNTLQTKIISTIPGQSSEPVADLRTISGFRDFTVSSFLFLVLYLILIVRVNPRIAADYFSIAKLFSLRESEDSQNYSKPLGFNLLYNVFASLSLSLFLLIIAQIDSDNVLLQSLRTDTYVSTVLMWLQVSFIILIILLAKGFLTYALSFLFGYLEISDFHTLNFLRAILFLSFVLTILASVYFIVRGQQVGVFMALYSAGGVALAAWTVLMYFKMRARASFSAFHLFSYLCATELVTLIVLSKVLYQ